MTERLGTWGWKDWTIATLGGLLLLTGGLWARDRFGRGATAQEEAPAGREPVAVFDVILDRETRAWVDIFFDRPIGERFRGEVLARAPATVEPPLAGVWRWRDDHVLRFEPAGGFPIASEFRLQLIPERLVGDERQFGGETELTVRTDSFVLELVEAAEEPAPEGGALVVFRGRLQFNYAVDPRQLAPLVRLEDPERGPGEPVEVTLEDPYWAREAVEFLTAAVRKTRRERRLRLVVDGSLTPSLGNVPLGRDAVHEIALGSSDNLVVRRVEALPALGDSTLRIDLSSPVEPEIAGKYLRVEPETAYRLSAPGNSLQLRGDFRPGETYRLTLAAGMPGRDEAVLRAEWSSRVTLDDLRPSVDFASQGTFLSARGDRNVAIETINVDRVRVAVDRVYRNNLFAFFQRGEYRQESVYEGARLARHLGDRIGEEVLAVDAPRNVKATTVLRLGRFVDDAGPGLFRVLAARDGHWQAPQRWLLLTDLGAVAKSGPEEVLVWVSSITRLTPVAGAAVQLVSDQNQLLGEGTTDGDGLWRFRDAARLGAGSPFLVTVEKGDDFTFLLLRDMAVDDSGLDVGGAPPPGEGYSAYLYGERDLYRPGEEVEGLALVRDGALRPAPAMPALLRHRDPRGVEVESWRVDVDRRGAAPFRLELPAYALTGPHTLELEVAQEVIGRYGFQVEEFIPDRIKVEIEGPAEPLGTGDDLAYEVAGSYLFGPPAASLPVESRVRLRPRSFLPAGWEGFTFANTERKFAEREILSERGTLDTAGRQAFSVALPAGLSPPSGLEAVLTARVQEQGGRGVSARLALPVDPYPLYLGLRRKGTGYPEPGEEVELEVALVDPSGAAISGSGAETAPAELLAELYTVRYQTVLRRTGQGSYRFVSTRDPVRVAEQRVAVTGARLGFRFTPSEFGKHRVVVTDPAGGASAAVEFWVSGWGYSPWAMENPSRIELELDREEYRPGETASVQVRAPFAGRLLLAVEREGILHHWLHTLEGNAATLRLPVDASWRPNAYVTATLVRSVGELEPGGAGSAYGAVPIFVDRAANRQEVTIEAPREVRSEARLEVRARAAPGALVTLAAVDEGILQLIAQQTPDPFAFFYRKLALGVRSADTFGLLLPEVAAASAAAGGGVSEGMAQFVRTEGIRRVTPVAFWSGALEADASGTVAATFELPEFQGALRLMAVSASGRRFGAADAITRVRDPIVLLPTLPRILSFGEVLHVPVTVRNDTGGDGEITVRLEARGPVRVAAGPGGQAGAGPGDARSVRVADGTEETVHFTLDTGGQPGEAELVFTAEGLGERAHASGRVGIRADLPPAAFERTGSLAEAATELAWAPPADFRPGTARRDLRLGPLPLIQLSGKLGDLLRYPYGCLEQVVSQAFPLIYLADLAAEVEPELLDPERGGRRPEALVAEALRRVSLLQLDDGGFTLWPGWGSFDPWTSIYATHLLVEAERAGYPTGSITRERALGFLDRQVRAKEEYGAVELDRTVYALWVLARAGRPDRATMDFVRRRHAASLPGWSRATLAAAYAEVGDPGAVDELLRRLADIERVDRQTGGNYGSAVRDRALALLALLAASPDHPRIPSLADRLARDAVTVPRWTTQESGFALLALGQLAHRQADKPPYRGTVFLGDRKLGEVSSGATATFSGLEGSAPLRIVFDPGYEPGAAFFSLITRGIPTDESFEPLSAGLQVRRQVLDRERRSVDLGSVRQGDLLVVRTQLRSVSGPVRNVAVVNLLPGGLEVENPRLESTEALPWITDSTFHDAVVDLRDDRILLFGDLPADHWRTFYTLVRAVAPGTFRLPPIQAEAMYNPALRATGRRGWITVQR